MTVALPACASAVPGGSADPLRVLHVNAGNLYGGIETLLLTLACQRELRPDVEPHFALCFEGRHADELRGAGVPVASLGPVRFSRPWTVRTARRTLGGLLAAGGFGAVVCHGCWSHALAAPVVRRCGPPLVFWAHGPQTTRHWLGWLASWTPPDLVIANSRATAATLPGPFPQTPSKVVYLPVRPRRAPDPERVRVAVRAELETPADAVVFLQASRMEAWKGHTLLLDALARLKQLSGWVCWIAGGTQRVEEQMYLETLRAETTRLGLEERVRFLGERSDVPHLLAAADVYCQPNLGPEPFGIAFVEALYAGRPVVTTAMGGALEILDETCSLLVPPGDAAALATALARLADDEPLRSRLGAAGPARASALCDPAAQLGKLARLLTTLSPARRPALV